MTRVDFHVNVQPGRLPYACRVVRKARAAGMTVTVYTCDAERLAAFDTALWTFSALDFVPHVMAGSPLAADTPVLLAATLADAPAADVLLTLDDAAPPGFEQAFARYARVVEVASEDPTELAHARARFKAYREAGLEPARHEAAAAA